MPKFKRGQVKPPRSGRKPGSRNRIARSVQEAVIIALNSDRDGAVGYMRRLKNSKVASDRAAYCHLLARLIPTQVDLAGGNDVPVVVYIPDNKRGRDANGDR